MDESSRWSDDSESDASISYKVVQKLIKTKKVSSRRQRERDHPVDDLGSDSETDANSYAIVKTLVKTEKVPSKRPRGRR